MEMMQLRTVYNKSYHADKTGDMVLLSSGVLSWSLCEPAKCVCNTLIIKQLPPPPPQKKANSSGDRSGQEMSSFLEKSLK